MGFCPGQIKTGSNHQSLWEREQALVQNRCTTKPASKHLIISQPDMGLWNEVSLLILLPFCLTLAPLVFVSPVSPSLFLITQNLSRCICSPLSVCVCVHVRACLCVWPKRPHKDGNIWNPCPCGDLFLVSMRKIAYK